jgi:hypothetical protein
MSGFKLIKPQSNVAYRLATKHNPCCPRGRGKQQVHSHTNEANHTGQTPRGDYLVLNTKQAQHAGWREVQEQY